MQNNALNIHIYINQKYVKHLLKFERKQLTLNPNFTICAYELYPRDAICYYKFLSNNSNSYILAVCCTCSILLILFKNYSLECCNKQKTDGF